MQNMYKILSFFLLLLFCNKFWGKIWKSARVGGLAMGCVIVFVVLVEFSVIFKNKM